MNKFYLKPEQVREWAMDERPATLEALGKIGIGFNPRALQMMQSTMQAMDAAYAMDAAPAPVTTPTASAALQFLQHFLTVPIRVVTMARKADEILGRTFAGSWRDEEIVIPVIELIGQPQPYGDTNNVPLASFNTNFEQRKIFRMELGFEANQLEIQRASAMRTDAVSLKREAVAMALAIAMNDVAFNGFNSGTGKIYGLLNDPNLPAYVTVAAGAGNGTTWASKTFQEITADIRTAVSKLRVQSGSNFDPMRDSFTLAIAQSAYDALSTTTDFGISVMKWLQDTYPRIRLVSVPQFDKANGSANVFYMIADKIATNKTVDQLIQQELFLLGVQPTAKGMIEDYSNATAGVVVTQPLGVVRYTGI